MADRTNHGARFPLPGDDRIRSNYATRERAPIDAIWRMVIDLGSIAAS
jgi:hypothetical protein